MTLTVQSDRDLIVPVGIRRRAGIKRGDRLVFEASRGVITIRRRNDNEDEMTPEQRRIIDEQLKESTEDVRAGRVHGPFTNITDLERSLRRVGKVSAAKPTSRTRK